MKKIGVFISHIFGEYQRNVCQGIIDKALEYGYHVEIFETMDGEDMNDRDSGEQSVLNIPCFDELSGLIFASDTYPLAQLREEIGSVLKEKCTCPVIEIAVDNALFPTVSLENNITAGQLTEHLIEHHHYHRICYLGCSDEAFFSDQRKHYYMDSLKKHQLSPGTHDIFDATYDQDSVAEALSFFLLEASLPDAVVCYNDRMALLLMNQLALAGYHVPEDIAITGCDMAEGGQQMAIPLTSVTYPVYELGIQAVTLLIHSMQGKAIDNRTVVTASCCIRSTCGCPVSNSVSPFLYENRLRRRIEDLESSILDSMRMSAAFQHVNDIDDGMDLLEQYISGIEDCNEFYLCLNAGWDNLTGLSYQDDTSSDSEAPSDDADSVLLKLAIRDGKRLPECSFRKTGLLPDFIFKSAPSAYIFTPLFFEHMEFGYIAIAYENHQINYHFQLVQWIQNICQMLQSICDTKHRGLLVNKLESVYMHDTLTGLYNQHGYLAKEPQLLAIAAQYKKSLTCFVFDLDHLKQINDNYGHAQGDFAIQVVGHALSSEQNEADVCARFSGDEFYLLSYSYDEESAKDLIDRVHKFLLNYNSLSSKEYEISVSGGYAIAKSPDSYSHDLLEQLYPQADTAMYQNKRESYSQ